MSAADPWRLDGARAVVTGGTKGIGAACVAELARLGAEVWVVARTADDVRTVVDKHQAKGAEVHGVVADVSSEEGRSKVLESLGDGPLDVLVNNAGRNLRKLTSEVSEAEFLALLRTNLLSAWGLSVGLLPHLKAAEGGGRVVQVGSVAAARAVGSSTAIYAASKAAMEGMTRFLANEWAPAGVPRVPDPWTPPAVDRRRFVARVHKYATLLASRPRRDPPHGSTRGGGGPIHAGSVSA